MPSVDLREEVLYLVTVREDDSKTTLGRPIRGRIVDVYTNQDPTTALQAYREAMELLRPEQHLEITREKFIPKREARHEEETISPEELRKYASQVIAR